MVCWFFLQIKNVLVDLQKGMCFEWIWTELVTMKCLLQYILSAKPLELIPNAYTTEDF